MSINSLIINTLKTLNVPVGFQTYSGTETTYITFFTFNEHGVAFADDEENETAYPVQVDVWSKGDYTDLVTQVKQKLKDIGFVRTSATDLYELDTKIYHKAIRFTFISTPV